MLGGCASRGGYVPISDDVIDSAGKHTVEIAGYTKDASVAKEEAVMRTLRWRDTKYQQAHAASGFSMEFAMVDIGNVQLYLPKSISFKESPHFDQPLPTAPSNHPVWGFAKSVGNNLIDKTFFGWSVSEFAGLMKDGFESSGDTYNGDAEFANSFNTSGEGQAFTTGTVYRGPYAHSETSELISGE